MNSYFSEGICWMQLMEKNGTAKNTSPVNMSVTAKLNISTLYGLANIDLLFKITTHNRRLPTKDNSAMNPQTAVMVKLCSSGAISRISLI